jgi:hemoglobin
MKKDIQSKKDIELLVDTFYRKVKADPVIGYIFNDVRKVNWEKHLPVMYDFWDNAIFYSGGYTGNPLKTHEQLHAFCRLDTRHFDRWTELFTSTVDELFEGDKAGLAKQRARSIAVVMQIKIFNKSEDGNAMR